MGGKTNVLCLVDGVGRPRLVDIPADDPYPHVIGHARDFQIIYGQNRLVSFVCTGEVDAEHRMIYRQEGTAAPIRTAYLALADHAGTG